jgi:MoxR-like ATPase
MLDIFKTHMEKGVLEQVKPVVTMDEILQAQKKIEEVTITDDVIEYAVNLVEATRREESVILGASQRGGIALLRCAKAVAAIRERDYVLPDDIKYIAGDVLAHRVILRNSQRIKKSGAFEVLDKILSNVAVPTEENIG